MRAWIYTAHRVSGWAVEKRITRSSDLFDCWIWLWSKNAGKRPSISFPWQINHVRDAVVRRSVTVFYMVRKYLGNRYRKYVFASVVSSVRCGSTESISSSITAFVLLDTIIRTDNAGDGGNLQRKGACNSLPVVQVTRLRVITCLATTKCVRR